MRGRQQYLQHRHSNKTRRSKKPGIIGWFNLNFEISAFNFSSNTHAYYQGSNLQSLFPLYLARENIDFLIRANDAKTRKNILHTLFDYKVDLKNKEKRHYIFLEQQPASYTEVDLQKLVENNSPACFKSREDYAVYQIKYLITTLFAFFESRPKMFTEILLEKDHLLRTPLYLLMKMRENFDLAIQADEIMPAVFRAIKCLSEDAKTRLLLATNYLNRLFLHPLFAYQDINLTDLLDTFKSTDLLKAVMMRDDSGETPLHMLLQNKKNIKNAMDVLRTLAQRLPPNDLFLLLSKKDEMNNNFYNLALKQESADVLACVLELYKPWPTLLWALMIESPMQPNQLLLGVTQLCISNHMGAYLFSQFNKLHLIMRDLIHCKPDYFIPTVARACRQVSLGCDISLPTAKSNFTFFPLPCYPDLVETLNDISAGSMQFFFDNILSFLLTYEMNNEKKEKVQAILDYYQLRIGIELMPSFDPIAALEPVYQDYRQTDVNLLLRPNGGA